MRVLTVKQPWATLIALCLKPVENRTWPPPAELLAGERFGVHAGVGWDEEGARRVGCTLDRRALPRGVIVCTAAVDRVVTELPGEIYFVGPLGWLLRDVVRTTSPKLRGQLGLWRVDEALVQPLCWDAFDAGDGVVVNCTKLRGHVVAGDPRHTDGGDVWSDVEPLP